jgi:hypothetical protein
MQTKKRLLCPERLRRVRRPFGWVDTRLIREEWLAGCSPTAWALYLFWVTVADAQGLSYYADLSVARYLGITPAAVQAGRLELSRAGLLVYELPLVQVLSLERQVAGQRGAGRGDRPEEAVLIGGILRSLVQGGRQ